MLILSLFLTVPCETPCPLELMISLEAIGCCRLLQLVGWGCEKYQ